MSNIIENQLRVGAFTSSEIHRLCTFDRSGKNEGEPFFTYVEEKKREKRLKRSLDTGTSTRDTAWGIFLEQRVFEILGFEYSIKSDETKQHPTIKGWAGSSDLIVPNVKVSDIKCYGLNKFTQYADCLAKKDVELLKKDFKKEYWQLVSNSIINQVPNAEVILYAPYQSELPEIVEMVENYDGLDQYKYRFIAESTWHELNVIPDDSEYQNLNIFEFEVPKDDIEFLTERVIKAIELRDR
jgi:hypothetical protein